MQNPRLPNTVAQGLGDSDGASRLCVVSKFPSLGFHLKLPHLRHIVGTLLLLEDFLALGHHISRVTDRGIDHGLPSAIRLQHAQLIEAELVIGEIARKPTRPPASY